MRKNLFILQDNDNSPLNYFNPSSVERGEIIDTVSFHFDSQRTKILDDILNYLYDIQKKKFNIEEFCNYKNISNEQKKDFIKKIEDVIVYLSSKEYCIIQKNYSYSVENFSRKIIFKEKNQILYSSLIKKIEKIAIRNFEENVSLITIKEVVDQCHLNSEDLEKTLYRINNKNFSFYLLDLPENKDLLVIRLEEEEIVIVKRLFLQTIEDYLISIKEFISIEEIFVDKVVSLIERELNTNSEKVKEKLSISGIDIYQMFYDTKKNDDSIFFILRVLRLITREISIEKQKKKQSLGFFFENIYKISKLLYLIFFNIEQKKVDSLSQQNQEKNIKKFIEQYLTIQAYQKNENSLLISIEELHSLKIRDNKIISDIYSIEELEKIISKMENLYSFTIQEKKYFIHKYRLLYVSLFLLKQEKAFIMDKVKQKLKGNIKDMFVNNKKRTEDILLESVRTRFQETIKQLKEKIYGRYTKEEIYKLIYESLKKETLFDIQKLNYLKSINTKEQINYLHNLYFQSSNYPLLNLLNINSSSS